MAISLFKQAHSDAAAAKSACAALNDTLRAVTALNAKRQAVIEKDDTARKKQDALAESAAQVATIRTAIDKALADAIYAESDAPDLTDQRRALADAERKQEGRAAEARALTAVRSRYQADSKNFADQIKALQDQTPELVHAAVVEEMAELASEFRAAEETLRAIHFKVFTRAALADQLAMSEQLGVFQGVSAFGDLQITRPNHDAFRRGSADPWTKQMEFNAEVKALDVAADELHRTLLTGEA
jgi:hypothetical protein